MKKSIFILLILCLVQCKPLFAIDLSVLNLGKDSFVELSADFIEYKSETSSYIIKGNALMKSEDSELRADEIEVDLTNGKAHAIGNVLVINKGERLSADKIDLDLETKHGVIVEGKIFIKNENFYITGESFERFDENNYKIINGIFTTCDGDVPSWKFSASQIDIEIDEYVYAKNPVFYIKDIPAFYMPIVIFPIKTTRQSGFLLPSFGYSSDNGAMFKLPYYQVISDSADATIAPDIQSKKGKGLDTELRYMLRENSSGIANWYIMDEYGSDDNRWKVTYKHQEYFTPTLFLKMNLTDISDLDYFNDFGEDANEQRKEKLESNVTLTKIYNNAIIQLEYSHDKDLIYDEAVGDPSSTYEQAPKITASLYKTRIGNSAFSYSGSAVFNNYIQKTSDDFTYVKLEPSLSADFNLGQYATVTPELTGISARFWLHNDLLKDKDDYDSYLAKINLSSNILRIFDSSDTLKIRHMINPQIEYEYIPKDDVYEEYFDLAEIEKGKNEISLILINRLSRRREKKGNYYYSEPLRLEIKQTYDFYESGRELTSPDDERQPLKPLFIEADIRAANNFYFNTRLYHYHYNTDHLRRYSASMSLKDKRKNTFKIGYSYLKDSSNYIKTFVNLNLGYGISFNNTIRHDYLENDYLETIYGIKFDMQCWGMNIRYTERDVEEEINGVIEERLEKVVFVYFSLKGIGETGDLTIASD